MYPQITTRGFDVSSDARIQVTHSVLSGSDTDEDQLSAGGTAGGTDNL
jgi:hypothetical protein